MAVITGTPAGEMLNGTISADTINGLDGSDTLNGFAGNDVLDGGSDADTIDGGDGNDTIKGFTSGDVVDGGNGNDTIVLIATSAALNAAANGDIANVEWVSAASATAAVTIDLSSQLESINITGGKYADILTGTAAANIINAGAGNDIINGFAGADSIIGGKGTDTLFLTETSADLNNATNAQLATVERVSAAAASDGVIIDLHLQTEVLTVTGSAFDDVITGGAAADGISAGDGNDIINGLVGSDTVDGGTGNDTIALTATSSVLNAAPDARIVNVEAISAADAVAGVTIKLSLQSEGFRIISSAFNDVITGTAGADMIDAGAGNDTINGFVGADHVDGGANFDTLVLTTTSAALNAAADGDLSNVEAISVVGAKAGVTVNLGNQSDGFTIAGTKYADTLTGSSGDDVLIGGAGADKLAGGDGVDTVSYATSLVAVGIDLLMGQGHEGDAEGDIYTAIENATGGAGNDGIQGDDNDNVLIGGAGDDALVGGGGNDTFIGGDGSDLIVGGDGIDTISYADRTADVGVNLGSGGGGSGAFERDLFVEIENAIGGSGNDALIGNSAANMLDGGAGNDWLMGVSGDDLLIGGAGNDRLDGGDGIDTVSYAGSTIAVNADLIFQVATLTNGESDSYDSIENLVGGLAGDTLRGGYYANMLDGGAGDDVLVGDRGDDILIGGLGNDTLSGDFGREALNSGSDTFVFATGGGSDTVLDYIPGADKFDFSGVVGVHSFGDFTLTTLTATNEYGVTYDWGTSIDWGVAGESVKVMSATIATLQAHQSDFIFA